MCRVFQAIELIRSCPRGEVKLTFNPAKQSQPTPAQASESSTPQQPQQQPEKMEVANSVQAAAPTPPSVNGR